MTVEGDELVTQAGTNHTLRGGNLPLNTWAQIAIQQNGTKLVLNVYLVSGTTRQQYVGIVYQWSGSE